MEKVFSSLLMRQLKRSKVDFEKESVPTAEILELLSRIDSSYDDFKERESRYEHISRKSSEEIASYLEKIRVAEAINKQQHADITNMLRYIKQGIFSITSSLEIHPEFSQHTTEILDRKDIARKSVGEVLLSHALIDDDQKDQISTSLGYILGADEIAFDANAHILPRKLLLSSHGKEKHLDLDWTPIFNDQGVIDKILVTVRDVSELIKLEKTNKNQQKEIEILQLLLNTNKTRFENFQRFSESGLLQAIETIKKSGREISLTQLQDIYRTLHTIKGNARMYSFRSLSNAVHDAEEPYKTSVGQMSAIWDADARVSDLELVREELLYYNSLAQKAYNTVDHESEAHARIFRQGIDSALKSWHDGVLTAEAALRTLEEIEERLEYRSLHEHLVDALKSAQTLAPELGKEVPDIRILGEPIYIHRKWQQHLESMFNHLLRNSMDHGLEDGAERTRVGKEARGLIEISCWRIDGGVTLSIQDDGRGLNIGRILQRIEERGLQEKFPAHDMKQMVQAIFEPSFSTKSAVTTVSGRGVGMDAVRSAALELGGDIRIALLDTKSQDFAPVRFEISLPIEVKD